MGRKTVNNTLSLYGDDDDMKLINDSYLLYNCTHH